MHNPIVSVVMAEYNTYPPHLEQAIKSMLNQTFQDFELIIVDDGGRNDLGALLARFDDPRLRVLSNGTNKGLVYSLNVAIRSARSDNIVRMDTDDIAAPNRIEKLHEFMSAHPEYTVAASRAVEFSNERRTGRILGTSGEKKARQLMRGDAPIHPAVIFRRQAIIEAGMYEDFHRAEDLALWCKLVATGKRIYVLDEVLLHYRVNPSDYRKRTLRNRLGEIKARLTYYPQLGAKPHDYLFIAKPALVGLLPIRLAIVLRNLFVLGSKVKIT